MNDLLQAIIVGSITGVFSAGSIYGMLKMELKFLRRDVDSLMFYVYKRKDDHA